jgi:hypothetical protein
MQAREEFLPRLLCSVRIPLYARLAEVGRDMMHTPIKVITVEREYGSRGGEFAT